ncbi:TlpA family protein disulfide reductase [Paracoccus thiocyanatus]|nr:TlpA disulfide reductase family protein [Paracoccus thiocyanatus]
MHDKHPTGVDETPAPVGTRFLSRAGVVAAFFGMTVALPVHAAGDDGSFPAAEEVGGEVFPAGLQPGDEFPMDVQLFDLEGKELTLGDIASGKPTLLTFFISAAPASVAELSNIEKFAAGKDINIVFANSDSVGTALLGGPEAQIPETVRTVNIIKAEEKLNTPMYVAPNNVFTPEGLSNRLGFRGLPTSYLIDAEGKVVRSFVGQRDWMDGDLELISAAQQGN